MWVIHLVRDDKKDPENILIDSKARLRDSIYAYLTDFDSNYMGNFIKNCQNKDDILNKMFENNGFIVNDKLTLLIGECDFDTINRKIVLKLSITYKEIIDSCAKYV